MSRAVIFASALGLLAGSTQWSQAATRTWVGGTPGNERTWATPNNWNPAGTPQFDDVLTVNGPADPVLGPNKPDGYVFFIVDGSLTLDGNVTAETGTSNPHPEKQMEDVVVGCDYWGQRPGTTGTLTLDHGAQLRLPYVNYTGTRLYVGVPHYYGSGSASTATGAVVLKNGSKLVLELGGGFNIGRNGTMSLSGGSSVTAKSAGTVDGLVNLTGTSTTFSADEGMEVGTRDGGDAKVDVSEGATLKIPSSKNLVIGTSLANSRGTVTIGHNGRAELGGIRLGDTGTGLLDVLNGGMVWASGDVHIGTSSAGALTIMGAGSALSALQSNVRAGAGGRGDLTVLQGGRADINGLVVAGSASVGRSKINIGYNGAEVFYGNSKAVDSNLSVSLGGVYLHDGGRLTSGFGPTDSVPCVVDYIGGTTSSATERALVSIHGTNSTWTDRWAIVRVGHNEEPAELKIRAGGKANLGWLEVGSGGLTDGLVTVDGAGSELNLLGRASYGWQGTDVLAVGVWGAGKADVKNGGLLDVIGDARLGVSTGSRGEVTVSGANSRLQVSDSLFMSTPGGADQGAFGGASTLTVENQGKVTIGKNMTVCSSGTVVVNGGTVTIAGEQLTLANHAKYKAGPGAKFEFLGTNVRIESQNPADVDGLANTTFVFAGGPDVTDELELCGSDEGDRWDAFQGNFAFGRIEIGTPGNPSHVRLADLVDNAGTPRAALYVRELVVHPGSALGLQGARVYALDYRNEGGDIEPGDGGAIVPMGAVGRVGADSTVVTYVPPGGDISFGHLAISDLADVRLESPLHQEVLEGCEVLLEALGNQSGVFHNGQLTLRDAEGHGLLSGTFSLLVFQCVADTLFEGTALVEVAENVWPCAWPMAFDGTVRLDLTIRQYDTPGFDGPFEGQAEIGLTPLPEPATVVLLAAGAAMVWLRRKGSPSVRPQRRSP
jgi:T5SS/PEP-CTERM-associated repeat protein